MHDISDVLVIDIVIGDLVKMVKPVDHHNIGGYLHLWQKQKDSNNEDENLSFRD